MAAVTLEDIARMAGVSRSTVSRVLNGQPNVHPSVRQRVQQVIEETGYHPNIAARTLAMQRSWMLGLVIPRSVSNFFSDPYFPRLTQGIAQACNRYHYTLALFLLSSKEDEENIWPRISRKGLLDGILVQSGQLGDQLIDRLANSNIPSVIAGRPFHTNGANYIDVDNVAAAKRAVNHLIRLGHRRIGIISGMLQSTVSLDRLQGYQEALAENGIPLDKDLIVEGDFTEFGGFAAMQRLLAFNLQAVFAASDIMAVGAARAIRLAGLNVPKDIALVGFDDLPIASYSDPTLTTIHQPISEFGFKAVELLIDLIDSRIFPPQHYIMETELVIRNSCGAAQLQGVPVIHDNARDHIATLEH